MQYVLSEKTARDRIKRISSEIQLLETSERMKSSANQEVIDYLAPIFLTADPQICPAEKEFLAEVSFAERYQLLEFLEEKCVESNLLEKRSYCLCIILDEILENLRESLQPGLKLVCLFFSSLLLSFSFLSFWSSLSSLSSSFSSWLKQSTNIFSTSERSVWGPFSLTFRNR